MKLGIETDAWELEDAEERHRNAPDLYSIPALAERTHIRVGDRAELLFLFRGRDQHGPFIQSERLWVTVGDATVGSYVGALDSAPASSVLLHIGDAVSFEPRHVSSIDSTGRGCSASTP